jgi:hypothetical protein
MAMASSTNKPLNFNQMRKLRPGGLREVESPEIESVPLADEAKPTLDHPTAPGPPKPTQGGVRPPKEDMGYAPARDFNRRANSLDRDALPAGLFPGSSKKLYDALYLRTRGAHVPVKTIRATRRELGQWSGIKNIKTIAAHLSHLSTVGLIIHHWERGSTEGSIYEVRLPEEAAHIGLRWSKTTSVPLIPSEPPLDQNLVLPSDQNSVLGGSSQATENKEASAAGKTSFKTNTERSDDDDAALAAMIKTLRNATKEITGKELSSADGDRWNELAEVLVAELKIAAARTTVSNVPAFLAEHLRRRLWKIDKKQARAEGKELPDEAASQALNIDASTCPDCAGSGWWYPEGEGKGVAKCKHANLKQDS